MSQDSDELTRAPYAENPGPHPWRRFVALGDSFTEGIGDPSPDSPGGHRGWADRVAEVLADTVEDFAYANLAVRGKLIAQIVAEQVEPALALKPDLITFCAGGNDVGITPVVRPVRGKIAIYNENLRAIAERYDCIVADQWALKEVQDARFFADDRLHMNPLGHHEVARMVLRALNVPNDLTPMQPEPIPRLSWRAARTNDLVWARTHLMPWVLRRLRHESSGDEVQAKRPEPLPFRHADAADQRDGG